MFGIGIVAGEQWVCHNTVTSLSHPFYCCKLYILGKRRFSSIYNPGTVASGNFFLSVNSASPLSQVSCYVKPRLGAIVVGSLPPVTHWARRRHCVSGCLCVRG